MPKRQLLAILLTAVLAMGTLGVSDWLLRGRTLWVGQERKKGEGDQPFLANVVFSPRYQARYRAQAIADRAESIESQNQRAALLLQAAGQFKEKEDAPLRLHYLRRACEECPDAPRTAEAWLLRLRARLAETPPTLPGEEIDALRRMIQRFGLGEGEGRIPPSLVKEAADALSTPFPDAAKPLRDAWSAATNPSPAQ